MTEKIKPFFTILAADVGSEAYNDQYVVALQARVAALTGELDTEKAAHKATLAAHKELGEECMQYAHRLRLLTQDYDRLQQAITSITAAWDSAEPLDFAEVNLLVHRLRGIVEGGGR
jgi:hypothetical protein